MLYLQIASPKSSVLNFLDSNSFEVIISIFQRTEKVPDMERLHLFKGFLPEALKQSTLAYSATIPTHCNIFFPQCLLEAFACIVPPNNFFLESFLPSISRSLKNHPSLVFINMWIPRYKFIMRHIDS